MSSVAAKAFPRGGGGDASVVEKGTATAKTVDADFLFRAKRGTEGGGGSAKKKKNEKKAGKGAKGKVKMGSDNKPLRHQDGDTDTKDLASKLTFETVKVGTLFLGLVTKVFRRKLVVSLPHQLMGYVEIEETSDYLNKIYEDDAESSSSLLHNKKGDNLATHFEEGQFLTCVAIDLEQVGKKRAIQLSLRPSLTGAELTIASVIKDAPLQAEVLSVEDYGYRLTFGPNGFRGFLPFDKAIRRDYPIGKIIRTFVESVNAGAHLVSVREFTQSDVSLAVPKRNVNASFRALKPGMMVEAGIIKILVNGVRAVFLRTFEASIQKLHLSSPSRKHAIGDGIRARILFIDYANKDIALSAAPHVMHLAAPSAASLKFGDFCYDSRIVEVQRRNGLFTRVYTDKKETSYPEAARTIVNASAEDAERGAVESAAAAQGKGDISAGTAPIGHVHISALADKRVRVLKQGKFKPGQIVTSSRVVGHRAMDNIVLLSTQPSVLTESVLTYEDLKIGSAVRGEVTEVSDRGVVVKLSRNVHGFIARMHLSDVASLRDPSKKYKVGQSVKCRVLTCDVVSRKAQLTCKKTLVRSKLGIVTDYANAEPGTSAHGFVSALDKRRGVTVTFFGGVYGVIPAADLSSVGVDDCTTAYEVGQVIACRIVDRHGRRVRLILDSLGDEAVARAKLEREARKAITVGLRERAPSAGTVVQGTVLDTSTDEVLLVALRDDTQGDTDDTGSMPAVVGMLPVSHVSDHQSLAQDVLLSFNAGDTIEDLLVLSPSNPRKSPGGAAVLLTRKQSLVTIASANEGSFEEKFPGSVQDVSVGDLCVGYITGLSARGVFVSALGHCSFFAPSKYLVDSDDGDEAEHVNAADHFELHQTVRFRVIQIYSNESADNDKENTQRAVVSLRLSDVDSISAAHRGGDTQLLHANFLQSRLDDERGVFLADLAHAAEAKASESQDSDGEDEDDELDDEQNAALEAARKRKAAGDSDSESSDDQSEDEPLEEDENAGLNPALRAIEMGSVADATILQLKPYGVLVQFAGGVLGLAVNAHVEAQHKKPAAIGSTVKCRILYVDFKTSIVDASLLTRLVDGGQQTAAEVAKRARKAKKACAKLGVGDIVRGHVELLKKDTRRQVDGGSFPNLFAMVTLPKQHNAFAVALLSLYNGASTRPDAQLQHNAAAKFVVAGRVRPGSGDELIVLVPKSTATPPTNTLAAAATKVSRRQRGDSEVDSLMVLGGAKAKGGRMAANLQVGALVDVRVKKIFKREMHVQVVRVQGIAVGTVHATDVLDAADMDTSAAGGKHQDGDGVFSTFSVGDYTRARILACLGGATGPTVDTSAKKNKSKKKRGVAEDNGIDSDSDNDVEVLHFALSVRPGEAGPDATENTPLAPRLSWSSVAPQGGAAARSHKAKSKSTPEAATADVSTGSTLVGIVTDVKDEFAQVEFSRELAGSIDVVDSFVQSRLPEGIDAPTRSLNGGKKRKNKQKNKKLSNQGLGLVTDTSDLSRMSLGASLTVGQAVRVRVLACDEKKKHLRCSTVLDAADAPSAGAKFAPGAVVVCRIREASRVAVDQAIRVQMPGCAVGRICVTDVRTRSDWIDDQLGRLLELVESDTVVAGKQGGEKPGRKRKSAGDAKSPTHRSRSLHLIRARVVGLCTKEGTKSDSYDLALWRQNDNVEGKNATASTEATSNNEISVSDVHEGALLTGFVANASGRGVFVRISRDLTARVFPRNLADGFVEDVTKAFPRGRLVAGRVLSVASTAAGRQKNGKKRANPKKEQGVKDLKVEMTLKPSAVAGTADGDSDSDDESESTPGVTVSWKDLAVGMVCDGRVKNVQDFGVFVRLDGSGTSATSRGKGIDGLAHRTQCADGPKPPEGDLSKLFAPGDAVRCKITKVDPKRKRLSITLKPSLVFAKNDGEAESDSDSDSDSDSADDSNTSASNDPSQAQRTGKEQRVAADTQADKPSAAKKPRVSTPKQVSAALSDSDSSSESSDDDDDESAVATTARTNARKHQKAPQRSNHEALFADMWGDEFSLGRKKAGGDGSDVDGSDSDSDSESDSDSSSDEEAGTSSRSKGGSRAAKRKEAEAAIRRKELQLAAGAGEAQPESAEDYERLLLGEPNSSFLWIRYVTYFLALTEVDKARQVCERALGRINFRHETDKLNVWGAYLNLEHRFGDETSLAAVLKRALKQNDQRQVYLKMADIYRRAGQMEELEALYQTTHKKFKDDIGLWEAHAVLLLKQNRPEAAKRVLHRALAVLPKFSHVPMITKFARAEFGHGSVARARTIFDQLVTTHPRRLDLWNVYVDQEVSGGHFAAARRLLERVCAMKWSSKKIRGLLKKWVLFEQKHGTAKTIAHVMEVAKREVADSINKNAGAAETDDSDDESDDSDDESDDSDDESDDSDDDSDDDDDDSDDDDDDDDDSSSD